MRSSPACTQNAGGVAFTIVLVLAVLVPNRLRAGILRDVRVSEQRGQHLVRVGHRHPCVSFRKQYRSDHSEAKPGRPSAADDGRQEAYCFRLSLVASPETRHGKPVVAQRSTGPEAAPLGVGARPM